MKENNKTKQDSERREEREGPSRNGKPNDNKAERIRLELGWVGRLFGTSKHAAVNIAGITVVCIVLAGVIGGATDYWKDTTPIIAMTLGYVFGKKS
jgi:hypothetical protein